MGSSCSISSSCSVQRRSVRAERTPPALPSRDGRSITAVYVTLSAGPHHSCLVAAPTVRVTQAYSPWPEKCEREGSCTKHITTTTIVHKVHTLQTGRPSNMSAAGVGFAASVFVYDITGQAAVRQRLHCHLTRNSTHSVDSKYDLQHKAASGLEADDATVDC